MNTVSKHKMLRKKCALWEVNVEMKKKNKSVLNFYSFLFRCFSFFAAISSQEVDPAQGYMRPILHQFVSFQPRGAGTYLHSNGCVENKDPKNEQRRPKTLWSKTKTFWPETKTHRSKSFFFSVKDYAPVSKLNYSHFCRV